MGLVEEKQRWERFLNVWREEPPKGAETERVAIWKLNKATLWYYPAVNKRYATPIYLIYSLINKATILDLYSGSSVIEALVNEGFDVYLIDFGIPGYEDKDLTMDDYIVKYIQNGAKRVLRHSGEDELTVIGFCLGGTLAAMYASIAEEPIKNLILDVAPIDFSVWPTFSEWIQALRAEELGFDRLIETVGLIPSRHMEAGVRIITSPMYLSPFLSLLNKANNEPYVGKWRAFRRWTKEHIPMPGGVLNQLLTDFVRGNKLVEGTMIVDGKRADLSNIEANLLVIASTYDRLVPKETTMKIMDLVSSEDKTYHELPGGHATLTNNGKLPDYLQNWVPERSNPLY
ncbi:alpha/beta fold hydrolase [Robertmurraya kyonggiensis]|uniref:Alpha/beta fold hydrolase n=1 Tax=Robertmurraya kyonggiensis TaxID=1037680 RepID=A0A4U1DAZ3_9BACI|nr:alpha/beta fold hydrolase [Robertmurraya kyonggiensis]TKC18767.1 alpha/beta fold hydrolase [Robertmurraya kyonggiensis]